jgi:nucleolar protein 56
VGEASKEKDRAVIQGSEALEDLDEALNLLSERLREWCSNHLPSLERGLEHRGYVERMCALKAEDASGMGEKEREAVRSYSGQIRALYALRDELEGYISSAMEETAPNLKALLGPSLGAKLLSVAGGLSSLARMPASRIQVLGAEKAMFRHLRKKGPPPKHGIIYQHPLIQKSPWWQRGKVSRALAGKVAIACRVDALSGGYIGDELKERLSKRVEEIKAAHPTAPKKGRQ